MTEEKIKKLLDLLKRPANVQLLTNPRVNSHIWGKLREFTRKSDLKMVQVGERLVKYLVASTVVIEKLLRPRAGRDQEADQGGVKISTSRSPVGCRNTPRTEPETKIV